MRMKVRLLLVAMVVMAEMYLAGCGHYTCGTTFGASSCSSGSGGISQGGGGTAKGTYLLIADAGGIQGEVLDPTAKTISITPGFGTVDISTFTKVPGDWMVIAGGKFMYSAYGSIGQIFGWSLNGNGTITALTTLTSGDHQAALYLLNLTAGFNAGQQFMITNPAGTLLFVADKTSSTMGVHVYQIATTGALTEVSNSPFALPSGFTPYNLAVDGQGKYLYVSNVSGLLTNQVAAYSIDSSTGALAAVTNSPFPNMPIQQMQGESTGKFMIGTSGGFTSDTNIYVASIGSGGQLTVTPFDTLTTIPVGVVVQPNTGGNLIYTFEFPNSGGNGQVEGFTIDATGTITAIAGISATGSLGKFDPNGKYFFVASSTSGIASALNAFDVTASPALASPVASVGWAAGAWQAFDTQ